MRWLYRYESKGIQSFILATERLREMVGASELVESMARLAKDRAAQCGGEEIMAAAGAATFVFPDDASLERFAAEWPLCVDAEAPGLPVVQAWAPLQGDFAEALGNLLRGLEAARNRPFVSLPEAGPFVAGAGRTGFPAVRRTDEGLMDRASSAKDAALAADAFYTRMEQEFGTRGRRFTTDLNAFGEGYLAVIHADGNGVGQRILQDISRRPPHAQQAFSVGLAGATREAVRQAFHAIAANLPASGDLPFRPLVVGGDDVTVIARARDAFTFTRSFLEAFEKSTEANPAVGRLTAAAGICFVRPGHPFHAAHRIAEDLCKSAKGAKASGSALAFFRVTTAHVESLEALRRDELDFTRPPQTDPERQARAAQPALRFHGSLWTKPWTAERLEQLQGLCNALGHMPRGALREWLRLVKVDASRAEAHWRRTLEIMETGKPERRDAVGRLAGALEALNGRNDPLAPDGTTPLLDAATWMGIERSAP